jgi:uncharacterized membrane protein
MVDGSGARRCAAAFAFWAVAGTAAGEPVPASEPMTGFVKYEHNKWLFHSCAPAPVKQRPGRRARGQPFIDGSRSGMVFTAIQQRWRQSVDPLRGVYVEFDGYVEGGRVTAIDLRRALGWVDRCANRPDNVPAAAVLWAAGNEPGWNFMYDGAQGYFEFAGGGRIEVAALELNQRPGVQAYLGNDGLRIEFSTVVCTDTMAEAAFGRSVVALVKGQVVEGCGFAR